MAKQDTYTTSELVIHEKGNWWTGMIDVPRGQSPLIFAEMRLDECPFIKEVSLYRNGRFIRSVRRPENMIGNLSDER